MSTQDRQALLRQLDETRNTCDRQSLLKQLWRLDAQRERQKAAETSLPLPLAGPALVDVPAMVVSE